MKLALIAEDPSFGASANLVEALRQNDHQVAAIFENKDPKGFWQKVSSSFFVGNKFMLHDDGSKDRLIIVGSNAWDKFKFMNQPKTPITVILTDSHYLRNYQRLNKEFTEAGATVFAMPDLMPFRENLPTLTYLPPFEISHIKVEKNKRFTICHSPGPKVSTNAKGTREIRAAVHLFQRHHPNTEYLELTGLSHDECLLQKAKAHVFIDQIIPENRQINGYAGGLGKSGIEAMHLGCYVISSITEPYTAFNFYDPKYSMPLEIYLNLLINEKEVVKNLAHKQHLKAMALSSYSSVANHVLQTLQKS
jgi:hypothetical protein